MTDTCTDDTEHVDDCPNCGNDPLESSQTVVVELSDGVDILGYLCGNCGIVYVPEPHETARVARVNDRPVETDTDQ